MQFDITDLTHDGRGVGRFDTQGYFVAGALPGETVTIHNIQKKKRYAEADLASVDRAAEDRIQSPCPYFPVCGGCDIQHYAYAAGLLWKQKRTRMLFRKAGVETEVHPAIGMESPWGYRNHLQLQVKNGVSGFFERGSHSIVPVQNCLIQSETANRVIQALQKIVLPADLHRIIVRTEKEQAIAGFDGAVPSAAIDLLTAAGVSTIWQRKRKWERIYGKESFYTELSGRQFALHPDTFFQVNSTMAEQLFSYALKTMEINPSHNYIDLYCGIGPLGMLAAKQARRITGVEISQSSVQMAKRTAKEEGIENIRFLCAPSEAAAENVIKKEKPAGVFVDPPRAGLDAALIDTLTRLTVPRVVYISCDPATLARDAKRFAEQGWTRSAVQPFDLFPWTGHIENVQCFTR